MMDASKQIPKRRRIGKAGELILLTGRRPEQSDQTVPHKRKKANLASLPAEVLFPILRYSLTPDLIHVCRSIWYKLPVYVPFARGLAATAIYMDPQGVDEKLVELMDGYWRISQVPTPSVAQLDRFLFTTVCSSSFSATKFEQVYMDVRAVFRHHPGTAIIKEPAWLDPYLKQGAREGGDHESLFLRLFNNIERELHPDSASGTVDVLQFRSVFNISSTNSTGRIPDFVIRSPVTMATARMTKCLTHIYSMFTQCNVELLQEAISSAIRQDMPKVVRVLLGLQQRLMYPTAQRIITLEHVKLAVKSCHVAILSVLLDQQSWFQISTDDLLDMVEDLRIMKPHGWKETYKVLLEGWRCNQPFYGALMYEEADLWAEKLQIYPAEGSRVES